MLRILISMKESGAFNDNNIMLCVKESGVIDGRQFWQQLNSLV